MAGTYETAVLADSPIAYYRLDETSGTTAVDQVSAHNATIAGSPTLGATPLPPSDAGTGNTSATVTSSTTFLTFPSSVSIPSASPGATLEFWANFSTTSSAQKFMLGIGATGAFFESFLPFTGPAVYLRAGATQTGIANVALTGSVTGAVHHWALTFKNSSPFTCTVYRDGVSVATGSGSGALTLALTGGVFGESASGDKYDNVAVYAKELTSTQVQTHFLAGATTAMAVTVAAKASVSAALTGHLAARATIAATAALALNAPTLVPTVTFDIYRSPAGLGQWTRIATGIPSPGLGMPFAWNDYAAAAFTAYDYTVVAVAGTGATAAALVSGVELSWPLGIWLHDPADPAGTAHFFLYDNAARGETITPEVSLVKVDGRSRPIAEFSGRDDRQISVYLDMLWDTSKLLSPDWNALAALTYSHAVLCYRDHRSRKAFGVIKALPEADDKMKYTTTLVIDETDFTESV